MHAHALARPETGPGSSARMPRPAEAHLPAADGASAGGLYALCLGWQRIEQLLRFLGVIGTSSRQTAFDKVLCSEVADHQ